MLLSSTMLVVLLASTLFRTRNTMGLVTEELQHKSLAVTSDQARAVSHAFNDKLWELHTWIGYFIAAFLVGRFILEIFQPLDEKLGFRIKRAMGFPLVTAEQKLELQHYIRVKWGYILFYELMLIMAITGIGLAFEDVAFFRGIRGSLKSIHSLAQYGVYGYVLFHITGVILADIGRYPGLISGMIHGKKRPV